MNRDMSEQQTEELLNKVVDYFLSVRNFDHPDESFISDTAKNYGISDLDAGKAFFVARDRASLVEQELLDGGTGKQTQKVKNYGPNSLHEMAFGKTDSTK